MDDIKLLERRLQREVKARKAAESILEKKALQLFESKKKLEEVNELLNQQIEVKQSEIDSKVKEYQSLVENAQHIIFNINDKGEFLLLNSAAKRLFANTGEGSEVYKISDFILEDSTFLEDLNSSDSLETIKNLKLKLTSGIYLELAVNKTKQSNKVIYSIIGQDVTKELALEKNLSKTAKLLEQSEYKNRTILANMKLGILEVDNEGIILDSNRAFCDITGYSREELLNKKPEDIFLSRENSQIINDKNKERRQGEYSVYELGITHKQGHTIELLVSGAPVQDSEGETIGSVGIHYDITYQKDLQREIIAAKNLTEATQKREKSFMNTITHEIKNPLNAIVGMTKLMQDAVLKEPYAQYLSLIDSSSKNLLALISDYLHVSIGKENNDLVNKEVFDLTKLLSRLVKDLKSQYKKDNVSIELIDKSEILNEVYSDPNILRKIISNLISQLFKMTDEGIVSLKTHVFEEYGTRYLKVNIQSEFLVLSESEQDQLFEITNLNTTEIEVNEENLNLALSQHLVKSLDTEILLYSKKGKGTGFSFTVDIDEDLIVTKKEVKPLSEVDYKNITALVIEDNVVNQKYISAILEKREINFDIAENGEIGLAKAKNNVYDIIFMDLHMPVMDGFTSCTNIKESSTLNKATPIIALTASNVEAERKRALSVGMLDFVTKPFLPNDVYDLIAKYNNIHTEDQGLEEQDQEAKFKFDSKINAETLHKYFAGDLAYVKEMFDIFCQEMPKELNSISTLDTSEKVNQFAHKIKPSYEMVGLSSLSNTLYEIEMDKNATAVGKLKSLELHLREGLSLVELEKNKLIEWLDKNNK